MGMEDRTPVCDRSVGFQTQINESVAFIVRLDGCAIFARVKMYFRKDKKLVKKKIIQNNTYRENYMFSSINYRNKGVIQYIKKTWFPQHLIGFLSCCILFFRY